MTKKTNSEVENKLRELFNKRDNITEEMETLSKELYQDCNKCYFNRLFIDIDGIEKETTCQYSWKYNISSDDFFNNDIDKCKSFIDKTNRVIKFKKPEGCND